MGRLMDGLAGQNDGQKFMYDRVALVKMLYDAVARAKVSR